MLAIIDFDIEGRIENVKTIVASESIDATPNRDWRLGISSLIQSTFGGKFLPQHTSKQSWLKMVNVFQYASVHLKTI